MARTEARQTDGRGRPQRDLGLEAYSRIKEEIDEGQLPSGTRITEVELSERLSMSRTPVREAIYRLESEGLLSHEPRRGLVVTRPDHQMIVELYTMREVLEGTAARLAAQHASEAELSTLAEISSAETAIFDQPRALSRLNRRFHSLIYMSAHNRYLLRNLENLASTVALLPTMLDLTGRPTEAHREHLEILAAITDRRAADAEEAARRHIRSAGRHRVELLSETDAG